MDTALIPALLSAALLALSAAITALMSGWASARRRAHESQLEELASRAALMRDLTESVRSVSTHQPATDGRVLAQLELLEARLEQIEARLPAEATLDKLASVNDAILATKLEETERAIARLDREAMSSGKVTAVVFTVLAAMFALVAAVPWIISQL